MNEFESLIDNNLEGDEELLKYLFFKYFLINGCNEKSQEIKNKYSDKISIVINTFYLGTILNSCIEDSIHKKEKIEDILKISENYSNILKITATLAHHLDLDSSLEISHLFTYLLWNGYFSKDKKLTFQAHDRIIKPGVYSQDIMNGIGVCLNFSDMLTDLLNECGYSAATLINYLGNDLERAYKVDIERNTSKVKLKNKIMQPIIKPLTKKIGNHAFNLIKENDKLYIYDSTNLIMGTLNSKYDAMVVPGKGTIKIKPYFSYYLNLSDKSIKTLDFLHATDNFESPYTRKDFIISFEECIELFRNNNNLFNEFYYEIKEDIEKIATTNEQSKDLIKRISKERTKLKTK